MDKPIVTRTIDGEYSTVVLPNGMLETMFFADDGSARAVARSKSIENFHREVVAADRAGVPA